MEDITKPSTPGRAMGVKFNGFPKLPRDAQHLYGGSLWKGGPVLPGEPCLRTPPGLTISRIVVKQVRDGWSSNVHPASQFPEKQICSTACCGPAPPQEQPRPLPISGPALNCSHWPERSTGPNHPVKSPREGP
jgi:hypothetical protein